jgi:hypothetical protein
MLCGILQETVSITLVLLRNITVWRKTQFDPEIQTRPSYKLLLSAVLQLSKWNNCCGNREADLSTQQFYGLQHQ